jgi:hypothetical protein
MNDTDQHLLADPGHIHQQYRQIRAGDDINFTVEFLHRATLAQNGVAALQRHAHQLGGDLAAMLGQYFQRVDTGPITESHRGDGGQHAKKLVLVMQTAIQTGMYQQSGAFVTQQQSIVRIRTCVSR